MVNATLVVQKLERGELKEGLVLLELLRSHAPDDPRIVYNQGMVYSDLGRLNVAESILRHAIEVAPKLANAHLPNNCFYHFVPSILTVFEPLSSKSSGDLFRAPKGEITNNYLLAIDRGRHYIGR